MKNNEGSNRAKETSGMEYLRNKVIGDGQAYDSSLKHGQEDRQQICTGNKTNGGQDGHSKQSVVQALEGSG